MLRGKAWYQFGCPRCAATVDPIKVIRKGIALFYTISASRSRARRAGLLPYALLLVALLSSCTDAWLVSPPRSGTMAPKESRRARSCNVRDCAAGAGRRSRSTLPPLGTTMSLFANGGASGRRHGRMMSAQKTAAASSSTMPPSTMWWDTWQEQVSSLWNDVHDPNSSSSSAPVVTSSESQNKDYQSLLLRLSSRKGSEKGRSVGGDGAQQQVQAAAMMVTPSAPTPQAPGEGAKASANSKHAELPVSAKKGGGIRRKGAAAASAASAAASAASAAVSAAAAAASAAAAAAAAVAAIDTTGGGGRIEDVNDTTPSVAPAAPAAASAAAAGTKNHPPDPDGDDQGDADQGHHRAMTEAAGIMSSRGESDAAAAHRGFSLLNAELTSAINAGRKASPSSTSVPRLARLTAVALLSWIRCETTGNALIIADDGQILTSDTAERRELWAQHAPKVLQLLKEVGEKTSLDPELQQVFTEAIMYSVASTGVVQAFVTGKASTFLSAMDVLVKNFPTQDNGVAYIFQGSYYLAAPWPVRSPKKALASYEKAVKINGRSRRNVYYLGLGRLACGDRKGAAEMFRRSVSDEHCESVSLTERDIAGSLREQSQRGLDFCEGSRRTGR